jgi:hypothetical protein
MRFPVLPSKQWRVGMVIFLLRSVFIPPLDVFLINNLFPTKISFRNERESFSPEEIASMLFYRLKEFSEQSKSAEEGETIRDCVIAVLLFPSF